MGWGNKKWPHTQSSQYGMHLSLYNCWCWVTQSVQLGATTTTTYPASAAARHLPLCLPGQPAVAPGRWQQEDWELSQRTFPCTETLLWNMTNWQCGSRKTQNCLRKLFHVLKHSSETWQIDNMAAGRLGTASANFSLYWNAPLKHDKLTTTWQQADWELSPLTFPCPKTLLRNMTKLTTMYQPFFPWISSNTRHPSRQKSKTNTRESETV